MLKSVSVIGLKGHGRAVYML